jgi:hypothetical protein
LSGDQLDAFITASAQRHKVVQCLLYDEYLMAEAGNLNNLKNLYMVTLMSLKKQKLKSHQHLRIID